MTNKVNFNAGGKIKVHILIAFLILLAGTIQTSAQKLNVYVFGESNDKKAWTVQDWLKTKITDQLKDRYPCAGSLTDDAARAMLDWAKQRQLMGNPDENALSQVGNAIGAQFVVSVNVVHNNGSYTMNSLSLDSRRARTVARQTSVAQGDDEALNAAESMAEKLVSDMINSMPDCYQNEWIGTITYKRETRGENLTIENHLVFNEVKKTTEITSKATTEAEFDVRGINRPARTFVKCTEEHMINISLDGTVKCGGETPFDPVKTVQLNSTDVEKTTGNAEGKSDEGRASVSVDGDEFTISVTVPAIEGGTSVRDWTLKDSGGCGDPVNKHESTTITYTTFEEYGQAKGTIDPAKPDVLTGSKTIKIPSPTGIQETKIITWNLRFIRKPSAEKIK
jgi:hypothetical protein